MVSRWGGVGMKVEGRRDGEPDGRGSTSRLKWIPRLDGRGQAVSQLKDTECAACLVGIGQDIIITSRTSEKDRRND